MQDGFIQISKYYDMAFEFAVSYAMQILSAILIVAIGVIASNYIYNVVIKILSKYNIDKTVSQFIANFVRILIVVMMGVLALGKLGISIAPFIAALGALSLTAGLALQGSVSNFAAGIVLILTKPFKIGDTITIHNIYGVVKEIKLAATFLVNEDKELISIPNKFMIGDILINSYSCRVVEGSVGVSYESDIENVIRVIENVLLLNEYVDTSHEAIIGIEKFNESSIDIGYRYWVESKRFFKTQYEVNLEIRKAFQKESIFIAFPQREIKILGARSV